MDGLSPFPSMGLMRRCCSLFVLFSPSLLAVYSFGGLTFGFSVFLIFVAIDPSFGLFPVWALPSQDIPNPRG
jgi:hypothetical protein